MGHRSTTLRHALLIAGLLAGVSGLGAPAYAVDDGYDNVFSSVLTAAGVLSPKKTPDIEYRERAPLVLPPKGELVAPVAKGAARPASWPQDPDVIARRKADEKARAPMEDTFVNSRNGVLSREELMKGRALQEGGVEPETETCGGFGNNDRNCLLLSPDQLREQGEKFEAANGIKPGTKKDVLTAGAEPERVYLTQPPKGYMKATKTVKATVEAPRQQIDEANPKSQLLYKPPADEE